MIHLSKPNHQWIGSVYCLSSAVSNGTSGPVLGQAFSPLVFHQDPSGTGSPKDLGVQGWRSRICFGTKKSWDLGWHVCILDNFGLIQMIQMNSCSMLTSGVRYPHFLSCISPNLTNDRNPRPLIFPCSLLAVIHVSSRRFHYSQCTTSGLDDRIFPSESGAIPLVVEGQTSGFLFDSESYPTTCPWIWRFGTCADECR